MFAPAIHIGYAAATGQTAIEVVKPIMFESITISVSGRIVA